MSSTVITSRKSSPSKSGIREQRERSHSFASDSAVGFSQDRQTESPVQSVTGFSSSFLREFGQDDTPLDRKGKNRSVDSRESPPSNEPSRVLPLFTSLNLNDLASQPNINNSRRRSDGVGSRPLSPTSGNATSGSSSDYAGSCSAEPSSPASSLNASEIPTTITIDFSRIPPPPLPHVASRDTKKCCTFLNVQ